VPQIGRKRSESVARSPEEDKGQGGEGEGQLL